MHLHETRTQLTADVECAGRRSRYDSTAEPVDGVVGQPNGVVVFTGVRHHGEDRTEDLLLRDPRVVRADEDRGLVEEALGHVVGALAAAQQLRSLVET